MAGSPQEFVGWALPQLGKASLDTEAAVVALTALQDFLNIGEPAALERFAPSILKACQSLLEDEGTSMTLLRPLLGVLVVLGFKFSWCVQPHFADMVDLLLGWALESEVSEVDCRFITDSFVQFQKLWVGNLSFSINLLLKFLGDMEVLAQDTTPTTPQQLRRLLALASCFVTVLQATTSGVLEAEKGDLIIEPALEMLPRLIICLVTVGRKFADFSWTVIACQCMTLFAEFLKENFANYYSSALQVLFQSLASETKSAQRGSVLGLFDAPAGIAVQSHQVLSLLQVNLQLICAQGHGLQPSAVSKLLEWDSPFSGLRLHSSRSVTAVVATTYLLLLQHGSMMVSLEASKCLKEELDSLRFFLAQVPGKATEVLLKCPIGRITDVEAVALFKFDLTALTGSACLKKGVTLKSLGEKNLSACYAGDHADRQLVKLMDLKRFILEKLNPSQDPLQWYPSLQLVVVQALRRICSLIVSMKVSGVYSKGREYESVGMDLLNECYTIIVPSLHTNASLPLKLEVLDWICHLCEAVISEKDVILSLKMKGSHGLNANPIKIGEVASLSSSFLCSLLTAASHSEPKVRGRVATVFELLLQAEMVGPSQLQAIAVVALEQLGDSEPALQAAFRKVLAAVGPAALWMRGWICSSSDLSIPSQACWKQMYPVKTSSQHLRPQQLVTILNYVSQRWQNLPLSWLQRLVHNCPSNARSGSAAAEEEERSTRVDSSSGDFKTESGPDELGYDAELLERACGSNNLAAGWWAIQIGARHFITVRLRTHLGGPTQTFADLERMLVNAAQLFQSDGGQRDIANSINSMGVQLLPMRLLLEFVEALEKNIYNAYEGSVILTPAPTASAPFFRTNKKVCEEWFVRIRDALMNLSVAIQCYSGTFYHASLKLQDLTAITATALRDSSRSQSSDNHFSVKIKVQQDVYRVLRHASLALCRAHEVDALLGLQMWTTLTFGPLLTEDSSLLQKDVGPLGWMTGLRYQAQGQYERAAAHYTHLLQSEEALGIMGADGVQFTIARTIESYGALGDWEALDSWLQELQLLRAKHAGKAYSGALTTAGNDMNAIHALARFDTGDVQGAWGYLDLTPQSSSELTPDPRQALQRSEQMLLQAMLRRSNKDDAERDLTTAKAMLEGGLLVSALDGLSDAAPFVMQLECIRAYEATGLLSSGQDELKSLDTASMSALPQVIESPLDVLEQDCHQWLKLFRVYHTTIPESPVTLQLHQQLVRLARKQWNMRLAKRLLRQTPCEQTFKGAALDKNLLTGFKYERILLHYAEENHEEAMVELWDFVRGSMFINPLTHTAEAGDAIKAKASLKLSSWLQHKPPQVSVTSLIPKLHLENVVGHRLENDEHLEFRVTEGSPNMKFTSILQEMIGAGTKAATVLCPDMAKAWFLYASWCYDHAKSFLTGSCMLGKPLVFSQLLESELDTNGNSLTAAVITKIVSDALGKTGEEEGEGESRTDHESKLARDKILGLDSLVQRLLSIMQNAAGAVGVEDSEGESPAKLLSMQLLQELQMLPFMSNPYEVNALVHQLMQVWWDLRRKRVSLFEHAARGFLQYLSMSNKEQPSSQSSKKVWSDRLKLKRADGVLSASLFVLRILLNYGVELEETLVQGLASVPPSPWQALTAQLFARLSSHPESKVRKQLEALLMSLANVSPWAIVYPTLVDLNACEGQPSEELHRILSCLVNLHPKLVKDVQVMIGELGAITVLWDEQWLSTLQDLHADVMRRIATLKEEAARVAENPTLTHAEKSRINAAKYSAMMAPVAVALERRLASTSRPPETPHEVWFQEQFGAQLKTAILSFKSPPAGSASLGDAWRVLDTIAASFGNHQKKSSTLLSDISPRLAAVRSSDAPMPGLEVRTSGFEAGASDISSGLGGTNPGASHSGMVTITAFDEQVAILATKTKPKKLSMLGSDGERYTYLLKGREDLRLDARIMQLLHAVNGMLQAHSPTRRRGLSVRYYSVTPISGRAGLIQWVNNLTSMYGVFKSWQLRVQAAQLASSGAINTVNPPAVPRPSDLFYGKIIPALKEKGLRKVISRRDWPQEVKRKVLLELMKETPRQLLHRELWCASAGLHSFSSKQEKFSGSVAVMSMVGYILGLGDRHLDNILVDFCTGDVVHIDYNVCFDKGLRLKIPEIVPFRLTQTIQAALGLTGVEGVFRANCEAVLKALQNNKDLILMLLEVFVWDPLVEWMRGDGHDEATIGGEERKGMELAVSLSLFASRVQEIRVPLQEHHDQLLTTLPAVAQALQSWTEAQDGYEQAMTASEHLEQNRFTAAKTEAAARALMSEASLGLEKARLGHEVQTRDFGQVKSLLTEAAVEMTQWVEQHGRVLNSLRNGNASELQAIGQLPSPVEALSLISAVLSAGVPLTIVPEPAQIHCREVDREVAQLMTTRHEALLQASRALQAYSTALQRLLPANYIASSDGHTWAQILQVLVRKLSPDVLAAAKRQALDLVARGRGDHDEVIRQKYESVKMHVDQLWKEVAKLKAECAELEASIDVEAERKSKDRLLTIFSRHVLSRGKSKKDDDFIGTAVNQSKHEESKDSSLESGEKRAKVKYVLQMSVATLFNEVYESVVDITSESRAYLSGDEKDRESWKWCLPELQVQIERWLLISDLVTELHQLGSPLPDTFSQVVDWAGSCRACMAGVEDLGNQMVGLVLPETIKAALSHDPAVLDAFTSLSRLRSSVDLALEQVSVIEAQRSSLVDLEKSYPEKVEQISKRQAELEHNAARSREHLSWEEAEELASEEEACRGELEDLHRAWAQRSSQKSAIARNEMNVQTAVVAAEQRFDSLVALDPDGDLHLLRGKVLLHAFARLFSGLEPLDHVLTTFADVTAELGQEPGNRDDFLIGGYPGLKSVWRTSTANSDKMFFVWKLRIMDTLLTSCIRDAASSEDMNLGLDQILSLQKKRLETQLHDFLDQYLRERLGPVVLNCLLKQKQLLSPLGSDGEDEAQQVKKEEELVKRALRLIHEYCDAHEKVRAKNSAVQLLNARIEDFMQALHKAHMEAAQMEWLHEPALGRTVPQNRLLGLPSSLVGEQTGSNLVWWSRRQVLDSLQSSVSAITRATESLQGCEVAGLSAEEQLDRAMAWACAGPSTSNALGSSSSRTLGIPSEFHEHLRRRRQLLWSGQEQASGIVRLCAAVLEFEASRDGYFTSYQKDMSITGVISDGRPWHQTYQNLISRLESTCLSFTSSEVEWQAAQKKAEGATGHLCKATEELRAASLKVESASSELQAAKLELRGITVEASAAVSNFCRVMRGHSALTVESGTMIEEVLAITDGAEGAHDVHSLAQEASTEHKQLMFDLNKINLLLLPLEPMLSSAATAFARATVRDLEVDADAASQNHTQAILQSLLKTIKEASPVVTRTVPGLITHVNRLHSSLTKLARTASSDAGVLHKALEGVGESQEVRSQEVVTAGSELVVEGLASPEGQPHGFVDPDTDEGPTSVVSQSEDLFFQDDECWISPPDKALSIESYNARETGSVHLPVEASQRLSAESGASEASESERIKYSVSHSPFIRGHGQGGVDNSSVEETAEDGGSSASAVTADGLDGNAPTVTLISGRKDKTRDLQLAIKSRKGTFDILKPSRYPTTAQTPYAFASPGNHLDHHAHARTPLTNTRQDHLARAKDGFGNSNYPNLSDFQPWTIKEKNAYAVSVLKRVRMKLEGRDINGSRQLPVADHVDHLLRQATSLDNLCNMYEGWTPWI